MRVEELLLFNAFAIVLQDKLAESSETLQLE